MKYDNIEKAVFLSRPNRFIAKVLTERGEEICHVKNTGRCRELLIEGREIYVQRFEGTSRKTSLDLICVNKDGMLVNIDSQVPNRVMYDYIAGGGIFGGVDTLRREVKYGQSRIDLCAEKNGRKILIEVKGVTLFEGEKALFPDAPTERGIKHLSHLSKSIEEGFEAYVIFVIQATGPTCFLPNEKTHKAFAEALCAAKSAGVNVVAFDCLCTPDTLEIGKEIKTYI